MLLVNVQGRNADISSGANEDVWSEGGDYAFPSAAAATVVTSDSANDDGAGTGARTVRVHGLDANLRLIEEDATMDGTSNVSLTNDFYRVNLVEVLTVGSGGVNAGKITVQHGATVLSSIVAGEGRSKDAIFTPYNNVNNWFIKSVYAGVGGATAGSLDAVLMTRKEDGSWQDRLDISAHGSGNTISSLKLLAPIILSPGEDVKIRAEVSAANTPVIAGMDIIGTSRSFAV